MSLRIEVFDDDEWADRVVERWATVMRDAPASRLCLPTGETPVPMYAVAARRIDFRAANVFMLDDFDLPFGHLARCDSNLRRGSRRPFGRGAAGRSPGMTRPVDRTWIGHLAAG